MKFCAVQAPKLASCMYRQRFDVRKDENLRLIIAAIHHVDVSWQTKGPVFDLFHLRADRLVDYILDALQTKVTPKGKLTVIGIKSALEAAFARMDEQIKDKAQMLKVTEPPMDLVTRYNSVVVIVHNGWVCTAGVAVKLGQGAEVILSRNNKNMYLFSRYWKFKLHGRCDTQEISNPDEPILFYFNRERIGSGDEFVVLVSEKILGYFQCREYLIPVLQSRIDVEGLDDACKSIAGRYRDFDKIIIVITLQKDAHKAKVKRPRLDKLLLEDLCDTLTYDTENDCMVNDPLCFLLPYVDGKKQFPEPQTSIMYCPGSGVKQEPYENEVCMLSSVNTAMDTLFHRNSALTNERNCEKDSVPESSFPRVPAIEVG